MIEQRGGKSASSVSKKTSYVVGRARRGVQAAPRPGAEHPRPDGGRVLGAAEINNSHQYNNFYVKVMEPVTGSMAFCFFPRLPIRFYGKIQ